MLKPFRFINSSERNELEQYFYRVVQEWNHEYSLIPFTINLAGPPPDLCIDASLTISNENQPLALIDKNYLSIINHVLFNQNAPCFDSLSQELFNRLLEQLFEIPRCTVQTTTNKPAWFYPGTTCLTLTLSTDNSHLLLILNPDWVYQQLPQIKNIKNNMIHPDKSIEDQKITLNVELDSITLFLNQLLNLQKGDVIATDHQITSPMRLTFQEQLITHAELGQSLHHKSIILKRYS